MGSNGIGVGYRYVTCRADHIGYWFPIDQITGALNLKCSSLATESHLEPAIGVQAKLVELNRPRRGSHVQPISTQPGPV